MPFTSIFHSLSSRHLFLGLEEKAFFIVVFDMLYVYMAAHVWDDIFKI